MRPFDRTLTCLAVVTATFAASRGVRKKSLSKSGAMAAWIVGVLSVGSGLRGYVLLFFYQIASTATKYRKEWKEGLDATAAEGSIRGPSQVLACSALAIFLTLLHVVLVGEEQPIDFQQNYLAASLTCAILAHHACCLADTLASELGILATDPPFLVTKPWLRVPPGTNGGITLWGTFMSIVGGALMGLGTATMDWCSGINPIKWIPLVIMGTLSGFMGSLVDSLLGATFQATFINPENHAVYHKALAANFKHISGWDVLTNVQVNLVSIIVTSAIGGGILGPLIFDNKLPYY
jgi:uncharacterized protein (TIGR00297 family)